MKCAILALIAVLPSAVSLVHEIHTHWSAMFDLAPAVLDQKTDVFCFAVC
jgi:hypothetical protein